MFALGDDLLVRVARRELGAACVAVEQRWLPRLPSLPLPVPVPLVAGRPTAELPGPWSVVPRLPGDVALDGDADPDAVVVALGTFLAALHVPGPVEGPSNRFRQRLTRWHVEAGRERVTRVDRDLRDAASNAVDLVAAVVTEDAPTPRTWCHGDLHPGNVLVLDGRPSAVIDLGDLCVGDPAVDLLAMWYLLDVEHHAAFLAAAANDHRDVDDPGFRRRARAWAGHHALAVLGTGEAPGPLDTAARHTLHRVTTTPP